MDSALPPAAATIAQHQYDTETFEERLSMPSTSNEPQVWYCLLLHGTAWYCMALHGY